MQVSRTDRMTARPLEGTGRLIDVLLLAGLAGLALIVTFAPGLMA